jgi:yecA family protein
MATGDLGGDEPKFETEDEMRTVLGTIMGRYNEIVACFNDDPE